MPCRFASSGTVATSRSASRAILALNVASNFLRDLVISVLHRLRQSRTLHTLTFGPISGVHFNGPIDGAKVFSQSAVSWGGHCWVQFGKYVVDTSLFRTAYSVKGDPVLAAHVMKT